MKAMILAAGLGTRLRPLTDSRPKALVEVAGRTLLEITLLRLRSFGVTEVIINVHHFADMVVDYLKAHGNFAMRIEISREDDLLLDTGGGLKKAAWFFLEDSTSAKHGTQRTLALRQGTTFVAPKSTADKPGLDSTLPKQPFLLHNVDVISTIDLRRMLQFHHEQDALATLAVQSRDSSRLLLFNDQLQLCGRHAANSTATASRASQASPSSNVSASSDEIPRRQGQPAHSASAMSRAQAPEIPDPQEQRPLHCFAFCGIHIISPRLLPMITESGVFSIIETYLRLAAQGEKIVAFRSDEYYWRDLGRLSDLSQAALDPQQLLVD